MKKKNEQIIIVMAIIVFLILVTGMIFLYFKNEYLEDKYEALEDKYEYIYENDPYIENNVSSDKNNYIAKEDALNIALKDLKISQNKITDLDIELEYKVRYNKMVYEISFDYNYLEYEYYIDPTNGEILDSFKSLA